MDIQSLTAAHGYSAVKPVLQPDPSTATGIKDHLTSAGESFIETLQRGETLAEQTMTGDSDPHALVEALAQSELAVEAVITVRNKVVEAYQEILRMPV